MANEVEIVITSKNKARPAVEAAKRDAQGLGRTYTKTGRVATTALGHIRDALTRGLRDAVADVNGETNRLSRAFRAVQESAARGLGAGAGRIRARLTGLLGEDDGRSMGRRLLSGISGAVASGAGYLKGALSSALGAAMKGATSTPVVGLAITAALVAAVGAAAPILATMISGALVGGIGVGMLGLATAALFHVEKVDKEWSKSEQKRVKESNKQAEKLRHQYLELGRDVINGVKAAAQPLVPVLDLVRTTVRGVGREFRPVIEQSARLVRGPLKRFVRDLGDAFVELKPAVVPLMTTFGQLLDQVGPMLPGVFAEISSAFVEMAGTVSENRDLFALVFVSLLRSIPLVINLLSALTGMFRTVLLASLSFIDGILGGIQSMMEAVAQIPGPWQDAAAQMAASLQQTRDKIGAFRADVESFPKIVKLQGDIHDLNAKIAHARKQLRDPDLTKTRRAHLKAEIRQLLAAKRRAQAEINALQGKTVTLTVNTLHTRNGPPRTALAHGGIIGGLGVRRFAAGGISGSGSSLAMVGEQGPELVRLPFGTTVTPAGGTRAMLTNPATSGFGNMSMAFRSGGGANTGLREVVEPLKDLARVLREVVSLRDGMDKLTGGIFGQERALSAYEAAWDAARKSLKENGRRLSLTTEKGRENRGALLALAEGAQDVVAAMREVGRSSTSIVKKMAEQRREFIRMARSMGLTSKQAKALADRYGLIPRKVKTVLETERRDLAYNKKATAYNKKLEKQQQGKAHGGIAGGWTLVGERGAELVRLPYGSQVTPAGQTQTMLTAAGGGGGRTVLEIHSGGTRMDDLLVEVLRRAVRVRGGDVQVVLGRP